MKDVLVPDWQEARLHDLQSVEWLIEQLESTGCSYWWLTVGKDEDFTLKWRW